MSHLNHGTIKRPTRRPPSSVSLDLARAYFLETADDPDSQLSVQASLDTDFRTTVPLHDLRATVRSRSGVDPGFDFGADSFSAMLGLALTRDPDPIVPSSLLARFAANVAACRMRHRYRYFVDTPEFAADTDCTALASGALYEHGRLSASDLGSSAGELLRAGAAPRRDPRFEGVGSNVVMVYWDDDIDPGAPRRGRKYDPVVCANALYTLSLAQEAGVLDHGADVIRATSHYVAAHLSRSEAVLGGTRYYPDVHAFLFAVSRLCGRSDTYARLFRRDLVRHFARARTAIPRDPLSLALLILTARNLGIPAGEVEEHKEILIRGQSANGHWQAAPYYTMGRFPIYFGSPLVTSLFAVQALREPQGKSGI